MKISRLPTMSADCITYNENIYFYNHIRYDNKDLYIPASYCIIINYKYFKNTEMFFKGDIDIKEILNKGYNKPDSKCFDYYEKMSYKMLKSSTVTIINTFSQMLCERDSSIETICHTETDDQMKKLLAAIGTNVTIKFKKGKIISINYEYRINSENGLSTIQGCYFDFD